MFDTAPLGSHGSVRFRFAASAMRVHRCTIVLSAQLSPPRIRAERTH
ncbi:hypothetical protein Drose_03305 [Dactylosporangium roseum]|uniref:Uncharacterized protein n=1 Tax=Dactylosporangium roseum TaxID=47989 RepID=A0ABY5Z772_9ACTN|nr:hypothetical protein [Dactylosporangium roseum]UWZ37327.1 hypothetical protein Drose_03305 [Dactylosporangium roseum]